MKVLVAIPALDMVATDFAMSLATLMSTRAYDKKLQREAQVSLFCQRGSIIMEARNACVAAAEQIGASHILFIDSDMSFPPDTLDRLLAHHVDIVGGNYVRRTEERQMLGQEILRQKQLLPRQQKGLLQEQLSGFWLREALA